MAQQVEAAAPHAAIGTTSLVFRHIHEKETNIVIYERSVANMQGEIHQLENSEINFRASGSYVELKTALTQQLSLFPKIYQDILFILETFQELTALDSFKIQLETVNTNMCRRFHTDMNDLRLLCTYSGPGTLWLIEDNIDRKALHSGEENDSIVIDHTLIQQVQTGAVVLLKGALFPIAGTQAVVHRSPTIEETGEKRLLLRIDTNAHLNFG